MFAESHLKWTLTDWSKLAFTDEATFESGSIHSKFWQDTNLPKKQIFVNKQHINLKVWGAIRLQGVGPIVRIRGMLDGEAHERIINENMLDWLHEGLTLQQDNAPWHSPTRTWLLSEGLSVIQWPSQSPDFNIIENIWGIIKKKLSPDITHEDRLWEEVVKVWNSIDSIILLHLYQSLPERMQLIIQNNSECIPN